MTFVLTDDTVNTYGFSLDMGKLKLDRFKSNPVMLYNHGELIGRWENIRIKKGKLLADPVFMEEEGEKTASKVKKRVDNGFTKGASLGIHILGWIEEEGAPPKAIAEVLESSICDIPSNANSLVLMDSKGFKLDTKAIQYCLSAKPLNSKDGSSDREQWTFEDWRKKDTRGLLAIKASDPDRYSMIVYGKKLSVNKVPEGREQWTFEDWRKKDTRGLLAIKASDPDRYSMIVNGEN